MTGDLMPFDLATHKVVDALLPWFVSGTLDSDERDLVQRHLRECTLCQRDAEWLGDLYGACVAGEAQAGASTVFGKLRRDLEASRRSRGRPRTLHSFSPWALAAGLAILVALGIVWSTVTEGPALYRTLGAEESGSATRRVLVVAFDPATSESELRRILRAAQARIVDGPNSTNAYLLEVAPGRHQEALQTLRTEPAVMLVERLAPGATH